MSPKFCDVRELVARRNFSYLKICECIGDHVIHILICYGGLGVYRGFHDSRISCL